MPHPPPRWPSPRLAEEPDVDLALDVCPFLRLAEAIDELLKGVCVFRGELEPSQEVERPAQVAAVVEPAGDRRQVLEPGSNVVRALFEDPAAVALGQLPPGV